MELPLYIFILFFAIAFIYGSVGHGGASGYLAILTLTGFFTPGFVPVVLILNILVSSIALYNYGSHGHFLWKLFWPFAITSIPAAYFGGITNPDLLLFYLIVGITLILMAAIIVVRTFKNFDGKTIKPVSIPIALLCGAGIGYLSGLIGVGGGIFLSPLILFLGWGNIRQIAAVSALFILVNSASGLIGHAQQIEIMWTTAFSLAIPVIAGGFLGSRYGVITVKPDYIRILLAVVLIIAGIKMITQYLF